MMALRFHLWASAIDLVSWCGFSGSALWLRCVRGMSDATDWGHGREIEGGEEPF